MKVTVALSVTEHGVQTTIQDEPWDAAQANTDGLHRATDNATYRGVRFGRNLQAELGYVALGLVSLPNYAEIYEARGGEVEIADDILAEIVRRSEKIDHIVANAKPAAPTHQCAEAGCNSRVSTSGGYCRQCAFDNE